MIDFTRELILIDKPTGITSFDVIRALRRAFRDTNDGAKAPKMGHAGTLDPLATGLMLIGVGAGTKRLTELTKLEKEYEAEVRLGEARSTGDLAGEILAEEAVTAKAAEILPGKISATLAAMTGALELPVSAYSAIKVDGVPMYKRAYKAEKRGERITEVPLRTMRVFEAELQSCEYKNERLVTTIRFRVGSGTYIRSLAEELGRLVGYPATLQNLRRTQVGEYRVEDAIPLPRKK